MSDCFQLIPESFCIIHRYISACILTPREDSQVRRGSRRMRSGGSEQRARAERPVPHPRSCLHFLKILDQEEGTDENCRAQTADW